MLLEMKNFIKRIIRKFVSIKFGSKGVDCRITSNIIVNGANNVFLGNNIYIGPYAILYSATSNIYIKDNVIIGPRVSIMTANHPIDKIGVAIIDNHEIDDKCSANIVINEDVWIGTNVVVLKGVTIGRGAVIAAGAVVNKDVAPYDIVGGVPARKIGERFTKEQIAEHERLLYDANRKE